MIRFYILALAIASSFATVLRYEDSNGNFHIELEQENERQAQQPLINLQIINNNINSINPHNGYGESSNNNLFGSSIDTMLTRRSGRLDPPPPEQVAKMARYVVQTSNWTSIATISTREPTVGFPCASVFAVSDGPTGKSTGVPYLYVTGMDLSVRDLQKNPKTSLTMTLAQSDYCVNNKFDPEDPRCAHIILTGNFVKLQNGTEEVAFAKQALFSKHPAMSYWPSDHGFFFAKIDITNILVLDNFGGAQTVPVKDYYKAKLYD